MKKLFGSSANSGSVVSRVAQQTMQYAGKAEKTMDDDYKLLSAQFKEATERAKTSEKILQLHYDAVLGIMDAMDNISLASADLFSPAARDGHQLFSRASLAVNGELIVEQPEGIAEDTGDALATGMAVGKSVIGKAVGAIAGSGSRDPPRTDSARTEFVRAYEEKVWKPVKQYRTDMDVLSSKRQQRNSMRLDYDAAYRTAQGYAKKPPKDITKKQRADAQLETTGVLYNMVNQEVTSRMKFFVDGRVKFWSNILKAVLECEVKSGAATNKAIVPCIKDLAAWIANGVPTSDLGPSVASGAATSESLGLPPATQPAFPDAPSFGGASTGPVPEPVMAPGSAPAAAAPVFGGASVPEPVMAPGSPAAAVTAPAFGGAPAAAGDDPWGSIIPSDGGGSAI